MSSSQDSITFLPLVTDLLYMQILNTLPNGLIASVGPELWPGKLSPVARVQAGSEKLPLGGGVLD